MSEIKNYVKKLFKDTFKVWKKTLVIILLIYILIVPFVGKKFFSFLFSTQPSIYDYISVEHGSVSNEIGAYELNDGSWMEISSTDGYIMLRIKRDVVLKIKVEYESNPSLAVKVNFDPGSLFLVNGKEYIIRFYQYMAIYYFDLVKIIKQEPLEYSRVTGSIKILIDYFSYPSDYYDLDLRLGLEKVEYHEGPLIWYEKKEFYFSEKPAYEFIPLESGVSVGEIVSESKVIVFEKTTNNVYSVHVSSSGNVHVYLFSDRGLLSDLSITGSGDFDVPQLASFIVIATNEDITLSDFKVSEAQGTQQTLSQIMGEILKKLDEELRARFGYGLVELGLLAIFVVFFSPVDHLFIALCLALAIVFEKKSLELIDKLSIAWFIVRLFTFKLALIEWVIWGIAIGLELIPFGFDLTIIPIAWSITLFRNMLVGYLGALPVLLAFSIAKPSGSVRFIIKLLGIVLLLTVVSAMVVTFLEEFNIVSKNILWG